MALKKTVLHDIHTQLGGRMVDFAGYHMPVQYSGMRAEHMRVRNTVGIFDVSHMGEIEISGPKAIDMVQKITVNDAASLAVGQAQYTAMCYENGGIVDDHLVYRFKDKFLLVVNAANKDKDLQWILKNKIHGCQVTDISDQITQLAVQGKDAEKTLQKLTEVDLNKIPFYWFTEGTLAGASMIISRTGYTGEPGFELYFENQNAEPVWKKIMEAGKEFDIEPIGLGARDTLRLEKKMCLYGNDIDETTNPLEARLKWIVKFDKGDFIGRDALLKIREEGINRSLIAFKMQEKGFPRQGYKIVKDGQEIGTVTSGTVSPVINQGIGMGYVAKGFGKSGTIVQIQIRKQMTSAEIVKPPIV
ncbi:MAG: glycine cleavage system aminomethyltransferase GcvT [Caldithrix sp.]|nr:glycine cleavage system aminomethyltransferase GcvT [Caldithrix sp.]